MTQQVVAAVKATQAMLPVVAVVRVTQAVIAMRIMIKCFERHSSLRMTINRMLKIKWCRLRSRSTCIFAMAQFGPIVAWDALLRGKICLCSI
mmetsp:Transcript_9306/g.28071  ORF Transcript_9306/g.28071 Transcript_9306/m.28071 type:complete len:92 (-) Transcript_9306:99-374(-)